MYTANLSRRHKFELNVLSAELKHKDSLEVVKLISKICHCRNFGANPVGMCKLSDIKYDSKISKMVFRRQFEISEC